MMPASERRLAGHHSSHNKVRRQLKKSVCVLTLLNEKLLESLNTLSTLQSLRQPPLLLMHAENENPV